MNENEESLESEKNLDESQCVQCGEPKISGSDYCLRCDGAIHKLCMCNYCIEDRYFSND